MRKPVFAHTIFCGCKDRFVSDLVGNREDRFSHNEAQIIQPNPSNKGDQNDSRQISFLIPNQSNRSTTAYIWATARENIPSDKFLVSVSQVVFGRRLLPKCFNFFLTGFFTLFCEIW